MTFEEYLHWRAFDQLEPIGSIREDAMFAGISKTLIDVNVRDHSLTIDDLMIFTKPTIQPTSKEENLQAIKSRLDALVAQTKSS